MPEWEAFYFRNFFFKKWVLGLFLKKSQDFGVFLESLIQPLFDNLSHAEVLALYLQS